MTTEDQTEVVEFLAAPPTHGTATVERIDTHSAIVFLAGQRAYKLKRAVRFDYLDFSTAERRSAMCDAEVRLNRRTAPDIYRGVVPITREPGGSFALGGSGPPIAERRRNDASDADAAVIRLQHRQGAGTMTSHRVEASGSPDVVLQYASKYVQEQVH
jgi:aminoglycoside phosphotransferase family enzyme